MTPLLSDRTLDVRIKPFDREEYAARLSLKITSVPPGLLIELTSEADLFLYFSLRLSDADFHALKLEQRLLVEFAQLPAMISQLLGGRQMTTVLATDSAGNATLSLVEANQFRELVHLTLRLKAGTDESVKQYLASRLSYFKSAAAAAELSSADLTADLKRTSHEKIAAEAEALRARQDADAVAAKCQSALAQLREEHAREIRSLHMSSTSEHSVETRRLAEQVRMLEDRNRDTEKKLDETRLSLISSESQLVGYVGKVQALESTIDVSMETQKRMQIENRELASQNSLLEKQLAQFANDTNSLCEQLRSKELLIANSSQLGTHLEESLNGYRNSVGQCEEKIVQLEANLAGKDKLLKKVQAKLKEAKNELKETQQALLKQESVVITLTREAQECSETKNKLIESQQLVESNAQVIAYLNNRLNAIPSQPALRSFSHTTVTPATSFNRSLAHTTAATPALLEYPQRSSVKFTARSGQTPALIK